MIVATADWFSDANIYFRMFQSWSFMHIVWISMKITLSEPKQPLSVLLQNKNSAIFRAETAIIRTENLWSLLKITEHHLTLMKISEPYWKCLRTAECLWIEYLWSSWNVFLLFAEFILVFCRFLFYLQVFFDMELKGKTDFRKMALLAFFKKTH